MKNISLLFVAFLLLQLNSLAQEGWIEESFDTTHYWSSVHFVDKNIGWIAGSDSDGFGVLYNTTNSGSNWQKQIGDTIGGLSSVNFVNENIGWVVGAAGTILKTTNGGENWEDKSFDAQTYYRKVQFIDENIGYITGGELIKTTNGGETWESKFDSLEIPSITFTDSNIGWVMDYFGLFNTTDGGENWSFLSISFEGCWPGKIFFVNDSIGWYVGNHTCFGDEGFIEKTTNGGLDWVVQLDFSGMWKNLYSIFFIDENYGWAGGLDATDTVSALILNTTDGGENWISQLVGEHPTITTTFPYISSLFFVDENYGWAVGPYGLILHTTNGGVSFVSEEVIDEIPANYNLSQNYPNPFNPITIINYQIQELCFVTLKVYDVLGNEIATLVNEEKPIGNYEVEFNAISLPSGIYFYRLQTSNYRETKKMVILK